MLCLRQVDDDMVRRWLSSVRLERYYHLFAEAGYDLPTVSRMTPEVRLKALRFVFTTFTTQDMINLSLCDG